MREGKYLVEVFHSNFEFDEAVFNKLDTSKLLSLAESHGVVPLLNKQLGNNAPQNIRDRTRELTVRSLEYQKAMNEISIRCQKKDVATVFLKGASLSCSVYERRELRTVNDIDILVSESHIEEMNTILSSLSYDPVEKRSSNQIKSEIRFQDTREYLNSKNNITVDLHWKLFKEFYSISISSEELLKNATRFDSKEISILIPSPTDHFVYLALHGGKHFWDELKWILDISYFLNAHRELDLEKIIEEGSEKGIKKMLLLSLDLAHTVTGIALSEKISLMIKRDEIIASLKKVILECIYANESLTVINSVRADIIMRERYRDKFSYLLKRIFTPHAEDWRRVNIPDFLYPFYYIIRPFRLFFKFALSR